MKHDKLGGKPFVCVSYICKGAAAAAFAPHQNFSLNPRSHQRLNPRPNLQTAKKSREQLRF